MSISSDSSAESAAKMSEEPAPVKGPPSNVVTGLIKAVRPRQWVKNLLVLDRTASPHSAATCNYDYRDVAVKVSIAFVVFCLAASSIYLVNDARDVEADRAHPTKRFRPIAAGVVPAWLAYCMAVVLAAAALAVSFARDAEPGRGDRRLHRHPAGVLLRSQASSGARHLHRLVGAS